ncbi:carboxypeptidase-like regulatory domain-containing protein [Flavobacterium okayamense]|uniref:Carboxypeptidase regulatory-like domain-containing protein n=1 Tax=Flavobacterium okayamense TaxID=2830782 RepID=A0ABM7SEM7_9FLAO|nr:carboxypeptidase-like regulatory domain-containing protein [Flavobacterium okayamense]BCY29230.1 hypothetical protein KK2020170_20980 [Flavobacterium okayamense]
MKKILLITILSLLFFSCENLDDGIKNSNSPNQFSQNFGQSVQRDFMGQVVDENNNPIESAIVKIGSNHVNTDSNGVFILYNVNVFEKFAYVSVEKMGYLLGSRSLVPTNGINKIKIMLIEKAPITTVNSGQTSEVNLPNGSKINFDGAFEDENGNSYSGSVSVFAYHLETSNSNISELMPGMLFAEAQDGSAKVLQTFGMLNVELAGASGEKLQIAEGHTAEISMKIDNTQLATASSTIPLWHFDEENGYWKEEGEATRQGDYYIGNVSHFSWWNVDAYQSMTTLNVTVVDGENNPIPNLGVTLTDQSGFISSTLTTNQNGNVSGLIPTNNSLTLEISGAFNYQEQIGSFNSNSSITIVISSASVNTFNFSGNVLDCDNNDFSNGYAVIAINNYVDYAPLVNGTFTSSYATYQDTFNYSVYGVNFGNNEFSTIVTGQADINVSNTVSINDLVVCLNSNTINLAGDFNLVVTRDDGNIYTFPNEIIQLVSPNNYKTTTTGSWAAGTIAQDQGYNFSINNLNGIIVPNQGLCQGYYSNNIYGENYNGTSSNGLIINNNEFYIQYTITFNTGPRIYTCHYIRN